MIDYDVRVNFTLEATVRITANSAEEAKLIAENATNDDITEIQGKSYADVKDTVRSVISATEVMG